MTPFLNSRVSGTHPNVPFPSNHSLLSLVRCDIVRCDIMLSMWSTRKDDRNTSKGADPVTAPLAADSSPEAAETTESGLIQTLGWVSAAMGAVALGLIVGREIRQRYKFNRRTPYEFYAHSGDGANDISDGSELEFGVGV